MEQFEIIEKLEKAIDYKLKKTNTLKPDYNNSYSLDSQNNIIGIYLNELSNEKVNIIIPILEKFNSLKHLGINYSQIRNIEAFERITTLTQLSLSSNSIEDASFLRKLSSLRELSLSFNQISDISFISNLKQLRSLDISYNKISNLSPLAKIKSINQFICRGNSLTDISALKELTNLAILDLSENMIIDISPITSLTNLTRLVLHKSNLKNIDFLSKLTNLKELFLGENLIQEIKSIQHLFNLKALYIFDNKITDISPLKNIPGLEILNVANNKIKNIESWILNWNMEVYLDSKSEGISLKGNPLKSPPPSTIQQGKEAVRRYFKKIKDQGLDYIYEVKLTLVGDGNSGKTSLQIRLIDTKGKLPEEDKRTRGIKIHDWVFKNLGGNKHIAHIWDFGGQDVYYPVHRFFLTENSVFLLLASTRISNHNFDYWIPTIYQFGGDSPILIIQTCHDGNRATWNDLNTYLANQNFNIIKTKLKPYYELNLIKKNEGLKQLKESIITQMTSLDHYGKGVPISWVTVREELISESKKHSVISFEHFEELCRNLDNENFKNLIDIEDCAKFLHSIGIILWYSDIDDLKNVVVLRPDWAMNAVYKIIDDSKIQKREGLIEKEDFDRLWKDSIYLGKHDVLKKMLQVFKIAFPKKHRKQDFIIPARLLSMPAEARWTNSDNSLRMVYKFDFMPKGLVNQLSAELSRYIITNQVWNNAVNLSKDSNRGNCQVEEDLYNRTLKIKSKGKDARSLAIMVMNALEDIVEEYKGVHPSILLQCTCKQCINTDEPEIFSYEKLLKKAEYNEGAVVTCNVSDEIFLIEELLQNAGLPIKKFEDNKISGNIKMKKNSKLFISYSKYDEDYLKDFEDHLITLKEEGLITFNCREIELGREWDKEIKKEIADCDIMVCLVSVKFLNTDYITKIEIPKAIEQSKIIIPIIIKACDWENSTLGKYQAAQRGKVLSLDNNQRLLGKIKGNTEEEKAAFWTDIIKEFRKKLF